MLLKSTIQRKCDWVEKRTLEYSFLRKLNWCSLSVKAMNTLRDKADSPSVSSAGDKRMASFRIWKAMVERLFTLRGTKQCTLEFRQTLLDERELKVKVILYSSYQVQPMNRQLPGSQAPFHFVRDWVHGVWWLGHTTRFSDRQQRSPYCQLNSP